jgi:hypothetical protein
MRIREEIRRARDEAYQLGVGPIKAPSLLYHYSSLSAICAILETGVLWATDLRKMKDQTEVKYASDVFREAVAKTHYLESVGPNLAQELLDQCNHIACLSREGDRQFQWENYADQNRGCALAFRLEVVNEICRSKGIRSNPLVYEPGVQLQMFIHLLTAAERIAERGVRESDRRRSHREVLRGLGEILFLVKNPRHEAELEWRLEIDHDNSRFKPIACADEVCRRGLPICTPKALSELVLGPECQMTVDEGQALLARLNYGSAVARRIAPADLVV